LQVRIDLLDESDWGERLRNLMNAIAIMVEAEMSRFPTMSATFWDRAGCAAINHWPDA
jgi:hypothetical protein